MGFQKFIKVFVVGILVFFSGWAIFALIQEYILFEYGDFLFPLSFVILITLLWSAFRFYSQRKIKAFKPLLFSVSIIFLAAAFYLWYDRPCLDLCDIKIKTLILPAEKEEFVDPETGVQIVRLTTAPSIDALHYYEPNLWNPNSKKIIFVSERFREKFEDPVLPVLHMIGTIDVETGQILIYKTQYSLKWSEWSRDGRYIYSVGLFKDRKLEPYFVAIDTWEGRAKALRLQYTKEQLPQDFEQSPHMEIVTDPKEAENNWLKRGNYFTPHEAFFLHLNPSGTLAGFEMYGAFGVVDLKNWRTWVVAARGNRGSFFDDQWVNLNPMPVGAFGGEMFIANVYTREVKKLDLFFNGYDLSKFVGEGSGCNHGNVFYENNQLAKYFCPGKFPPSKDGKDALFIADFQTKTIEIIDQDMPASIITVSADGKRLSAVGPIIYDLTSKKKAVPISGKFLDGYIAAYERGAAAIGGSTMISPDGKKVAFVSTVYDSKEVLQKAAELVIPCDKLKELQKWADEKHRTKEERERAYAKLNMPENVELQRNCELLEKYTPDIFVVHLKDELFK